MRLPEGITARLVDGPEGFATFAVSVSAPVHQCLPEGSGLMPCCGRTPFEVPRWHRMATDPELVTCEAAS